MSDTTLETYRHSGKFNPAALAAALGAAAGLGIPLGLAYAYLLRWIPFIYVNFLLTIGYGFAFGWLTRRLLKLGRVRNGTAAALTGLGVGLIALYCNWSGHIHALVDDAPWVLRPDQILAVIPVLYAEGTWTIKGMTISGIPLAIVWLIEAAVILAFAAIEPYGFVRDTPYSERNQCWLDEEKKIDTLELITDEAQVAAVRRGDLMPVIAARPKAEGAAAYTRLVLKRAAAAGDFCTVRVQDVEVSIDDKGGVNEKTRDVTADLVLPASMYGLVAKLDELRPPAPPPAPA